MFLLQLLSCLNEIDLVVIYLHFFKGNCDVPLQLFPVAFLHDLLFHLYTFDLRWLSLYLLLELKFSL